MKDEKVRKKNQDGEIREVKPKRNRSKKFILLYIASFAFVIYAAFMIISQSIDINEKRAELQSLQNELEIVDIENDYISEIKGYSGDELNDYIENIAREDLDYVKNGERVFINISGD